MMGKLLDSLLPSGLPLLPPASQKFFERIILSRLLFFLESNSILSPRQPGFRLDGLLSIKLCSFLSSFRMSLTNPGWAFGQFSLLSTSPNLSTLSGTLPFSTNSFRLASLLALLAGLNFFFSDRRACVVF